MQKEIERKWIVANMPMVQGQVPIHYERHFLYMDETSEIRIQKKGEKFEFERKFQLDDLSREVQKFSITEKEFNHLKKFSIGSIERESYLVDGISVKVYKGMYAGLIRAEVEFESKKEAENFKPLGWFGKEITDSPLGKDKKLLKLKREDFERELAEL